ncbi:MAG: ADP-ribosylation factor-like protein [Candidatus Helarchaeota archaeon]
MGIKVLIMGLRAAGKTTLIKHVLEGKEFEDLVNMAATEGVETPSYKYRGLIEINVFDCGGQSQFLENYYSDTLISTIFGGKTRILFWVIDSSDTELLKTSRDEFLKAYKAVREYSTIYPLVYVLVHKYDKKKLLKKDVESFFKEIEDVKGVHFYTTSCVTGTARKVLVRLLDEIVKKEAETRIKSLQKVLKGLNSKIKANLSTLINSDDGLEIASEFNPSFGLDNNTETIEFLQYLSVKVMTDSLERAKNIFDKFKNHKFITNSEYNTVVWRLRDEFILFFKLHEKVSLLSIISAENTSIDKCIREMEKISNEVLTILKL